MADSKKRGLSLYSGYMGWMRKDEKYARALCGQKRKEIF